MKIVIVVEVPDNKPRTAIGEVGLVVMGATSFEVLNRPTDGAISRADRMTAHDKGFQEGANWMRSLIWGDTQ